MTVQATLGKSYGVSALSVARRLLLAFVLLSIGLYGESYAQTVTIGDGTDIDRLPLNRYYNYSTYEAIYQASEINTNGDITNLAFYKDGGNNTDPIGNVSIYMKHTSETTLEEDYYNLDDYTLVYSGSFTNNATTGWMDVALTSLFNYNGTDNLQILVLKDFEDYISSSQSPKYRYTYYDDYRSRYDYSDDELPTYLYPSTDRVNLRLQIVEPTPMVYQASVAFLPGGTVQRGTRDAEVLGNVVIVSGSLDPLPATDFTFTTDGTTDLADIRNAKLWYSGGKSTFDPATATQFGSTIASPNGDMSFSGRMTLAPGANFFWLTYDVNSGATLLNLIDGQFTSLTIDGTTYTPFVTDPAGGRKIGLIYCESGAFYLGDEIVESVSFGTLDNNTSGVDAAYTNFSDIIAPPQITKTRTYPLSVAVGTVNGNYGGGVNVFIDWNQNEIYEDNERVLSEEFPDDIDLPIMYTADVTIPDDAVDEIVGMRVIVEEGGSTFGDPCGVFGYGETEDYYIQIVSPGTIAIQGDASFGNIGSRKVRTIQLHNPSPVEDVTVSGWTLPNTAYQVYVAGTTTPLPANFVIAANASMDIDVVLGAQGSSMAGPQTATLTFNHDGWKSPATISVSGYYASLTAMDGTTNLLVPGAIFDVGGLQPGSGQLTREFRLGSNVALPVNAALNITSYTITGTDAFLFQVSTLPTGITGENIVSVTLRATGAEPGPKNATLVINHSGANGPSTTIQLQGRIGQPVIAAPGIVNLFPVAISQVYNNPFANATLIPLTRAGAVDVQFFQTPTITGSGAGRMEVLNNAGRYFVRGAYDQFGNVIVAGNGDLNAMANWVNPELTSIQVTETQPLLLAVRMRTAPAGIPAGSYDASILLSNGTGAGVSNAVNVASVTLVGEVLDDPSILPFYPTQLAFGSTPIGTSTEKTLLVRNQSGVAGMAQLSITGIDYTFGNGARSISIALPADNAPVSVIVRFSPASSGAANGVINASGVISGSVALSGSGQAANPGNLQLLVDGQPLSGLVNFGNVAVGSTGMRMITVINNNVGPVEISSIGRSGANATQFSVGTPTTMTIAGNGGSVNFAVSFAPTSLSSPQKDATVTVYNSTGVPKSFNVRGTASTSSGNNVSVSLSPSQYNYGNATSSHGFVLSNTGTTPVVVSGALVLGSTNFVVEDAVGSFPRTIPAGGTTTVSVRFNAGEGVNGLRSASLLLVTPGVTPYPSSMLTGRVGSGVVQTGVSGVTGYEGAGDLELLGSYPNPSNGELELRYILRSENSVRIRVYSESGSEVLRMDGGIQRQGEQQMKLALSEVSSGRYYYVVEAGSSRVSGSLIVQK